MLWKTSDSLFPLLRFQGVYASPATTPVRKPQWLRSLSIPTSEVVSNALHTFVGATFWGLLVAISAANFRNARRRPEFANDPQTCISAHICRVAGSLGDSRFSPNR